MGSQVISQVKTGVPGVGGAQGRSDLLIGQVRKWQLVVPLLLSVA